MKISQTFLMTTAALLSLARPLGMADEAVGYNAIAIPASSDVLITVPFNRDRQGVHTVAAVTASGIALTGGALTPGAFGQGYYARFVDGDGEGLWSTIADNTVDQLELVDSDVLAHVQAGDRVRIYRHHTLGSLFPKGMEGQSFTHGTQVLIFVNNREAMVQNKSADLVATYSPANGGEWVGAGIAGGTVLTPETRFVVRNTGDEPLVMVTLGSVPDYSASVLVAAGGDLEIGSGYPVPVVLNQSGLAGDQRQVLFYDNGDGVMNKSAAMVAIYDAGGGQWAGAGVTGNEEIGPSEAITLRLPVSETATKVTIPKPY